MRNPGVKRLSHIKLKSNQQDFLVMYYLINDLKNAIDQYASGSVLDVGCGNKPYIHLFKNIESYTGCEVVNSRLMSFAKPMIWNLKIIHLIQYSPLR